jgi:hypothetical protein
MKGTGRGNRQYMKARKKRYSESQGNLDLQAGARSMGTLQGNETEAGVLVRKLSQLIPLS